MEWSIAVGLALVVAAPLALRWWRFVPAKTAQALLRQGALVVDVREPDEFREGHVADAVNIPLAQLREDIARRVKDKDQVLLLHCMGGVRSEMARNQLRAMGYRNAFNLGSYARARRIAESVRPPRDPKLD